MKAMINGKEIELTEAAVVFYDHVLWGLGDGTDLDCRLEVKCTDEGLIIDVWNVENGEEFCVATFGATAQELADDFCH